MPLIDPPAPWFVVGTNSGLCSPWCGRLRVAYFRAFGFALLLALLNVWSAASQEPSLTKQEECLLNMLELQQSVMGGLSRDADAQMRRVADEAHALAISDDNKQRMLAICDDGFPNAVPPDRQDEVIAIAACRYRDRLASEYKSGGLALPERFKHLCSR